jgi:uncharacterized protein YceH (UPF0502 family)
MMDTLSPIEVRILGVLAEKQRTVPDTYPLSLNALVAGCNQKTSRHPVMDVTEAEAQAALDELRSHTLVIESSGGRVSRYAHNIERVLRIPSQSVAILATLMLRGPQTAGELRINSERLHAFADISSVEGFLEELRDRPAGALVVELPRQPGSREKRWMHLLSGEPMTDATIYPEMAVRGGDSRENIVELKAEIQRLSDEVAELRGLVDTLCRQIGVVRE